LTITPTDRPSRKGGRRSEGGKQEQVPSSPPVGARAALRPSGSAPGAATSTAQSESLALSMHSGGPQREHELWFHTMVANSSDLIGVIDAEGKVLYANPAGQRILGHKSGSQVGQNVLDLIHPEDREIAAGQLNDVLSGAGSSPPVVLRLRSAAGQWRVLEVVATNCSDDPAIAGILINARDITAQTNLTRSLRMLSRINQILVHADDEQFLLVETCKTLVERGGYPLAWIGYAEQDKDRSVRVVASAGCTDYLKGITLSWGKGAAGRGPTGAAIKRKAPQVLKDVRRAKLFAPWQDAAEHHGLRSCCAFPLVLGDTVIGALGIYAAGADAFGPSEVALLQELSDDLAFGIERQRDAARLVRNEALLRDAERLAHVGTWEWNLTTGLFEFMAEEMFAIYGLAPGKWENTMAAFLDFVVPEDRDAVTKSLQQTLTGGTSEVDHRILRPDGEMRTVRKRTESILDSEGRACRVIGTSIDITKEVSDRQELEHSQRFLSAITNNMAEGMMAIDRDGTVTYVNAAAGRLLGWEVAEMIGRSGHETYHSEHPDGSAFPVDECPINLVAREGGSCHAESDIFLHRDGSAIPIAYSTSALDTEYFRGAVIVFHDVSHQTAERQRIEKALEKLSWVGRIRDALDQDRFLFHAQPIVDLATGAVVQNELLLRMLNSDGTLVLPGKFLPAAEEFGLIADIDRWVVREACRLASLGHRVEFNLSAKSVADPATPRFIRGCIEASGAPPESLVCEITETALVRDIAAAEALVRSLNTIGCKVALDDFGAGYGGFAYLKRLPVSYLKIDREFVTDLPHEPSSRHVVAAVVSLAQAFGMKTVAEGAEDEATLAFLRELGVDHVQGYVIARPGAISEMLGNPEPDQCPG